MENSIEMKTASEDQLRTFINTLRCIQCNHYVGGEWSAYDGNVYCQECWDYKVAEEERVKQEETKKLKERLRELEGSLVTHRPTAST